MIEYIAGIGAVAKLPANSRGTATLDVSLRSRPLLQEALPFALLGITAGGVIGLAILQWTARQYLRARTPALRYVRSQTGLGAWFACAAALAASAALLVLAWPLRQENLAPWPPTRTDERIEIPIATPDLDPRDKMRDSRAVVLAISETSLFLTGRAIEVSQLAGYLRFSLKQWSKVYPNSPFNTQIVLACSPKVSADRVHAALSDALDAGYRSVWLVFDHPVMTMRRALGPVVSRFTPTAEVELLGPNDPPIKGEVRIDVARYPNCAAFSEAVVRERNAGHPVVLWLGS